MSDLSRGDFEDFLYREARLLDERKLGEWLLLFSEQAKYEVPSPGSDRDIDSATTLFLIADNYAALEFRVERSLAPDNHADFPESATSRLISNVEILRSQDGMADVSCAFITTQASSRDIWHFTGRHFYTFDCTGTEPKILLKRTYIAQKHLRPQGRLSIIL